MTSKITTLLMVSLLVNIAHPLYSQDIPNPPSSKQSSFKEMQNKQWYKAAKERLNTDLNNYKIKDNPKVISTQKQHQQEGMQAATKALEGFYSK